MFRCKLFIRFTPSYIAEAEMHLDIPEEITVYDTDPLILKTHEINGMISFVKLSSIHSSEWQIRKVTKKDHDIKRQAH